MKKKPAEIAIHIFCWLFFLSLPLFMGPSMPGSWSDLFNPMAKYDYVCFILMIGFFYLNYFIIIPDFYFKKKYFYFFLISVACFFLTMILPACLMQPHAVFHPHFSSKPGCDPPGVPHGGPPGDIVFFEMNRNIFLFLAVFFISFTMKLRDVWKQAEKEKLSSELSFLKSQVNPHFLFNTLNSIYSLALEKSDDTATAIVKLSAMMRYFISEASRDFVSLEKELENISNYIELQRIRLGETVKINYSLKGDAQHKQIAPLLLIPFIENAFKHGVNPEKESVINIIIIINPGELYLHVYNKKVALLDDGQSSSGFGSKNSKYLLQLIYPSSHRLSISNDANNYVVDLTIKLK